MKTVMDLVKQFEELPYDCQTVACFNAVFTNSQIVLDDPIAAHFLQVQIGKPIVGIGLNSQFREVTVGNETTQHRLSTHLPTTSDLSHLKDDDENKEEELYKVSYTQDKGFD